MTEATRFSIVTYALGIFVILALRDSKLPVDDGSRIWFRTITDLIGHALFGAPFNTDRPG